MLPLLEMCQIRLQDVSLRFSKVSTLYGALCDCKPNTTKSWKVTPPHRAGHGGSDACLLVAGNPPPKGRRRCRQPRVCMMPEKKSLGRCKGGDSGCRRGRLGLLPCINALAHVTVCPSRSHQLQAPCSQPCWGLGHTFI